MGIMAVELVGRYTRILAAALAAAAVLLGGFSFAALAGLGSRLRDPGFLLGRGLSVIGLVLAFLLALSVFETWIVTALFYAAEQPSPRLGDALAAGVRHAAPFGWILTLASLLALAGFLFLLVPGVLLCFVFMLAPSAYFLEGRTGWSALKRSWEAMSGKLLPVAVSLGAGWLALVAVGALAAVSGVPFSADLVCLAGGPWIATLHSTVFRELTGKGSLA